MIVVDCSAVVDVLIGGRRVGKLVELLSAEDLHAPELLNYEVVAAVRGLVMGGRLEASRAEDLLADFAELPIEQWSAEASLRRRAFELRHNMSAYDADYVSLAEAMRCPLVTRDRRLARSSGHVAQVFVR